MNEAFVDQTGERPVLRFERLLARPPAAVWRALVEPAELERWFPCQIQTEEWRAGAALRFVFAGHGFEIEGRVLECDEPRMLAYTWGKETLRFELFEDAGGTRLVFTDELDPAIAARNAAGWDVCLELLEGRVAEEGLWKRRFERYVEALTPALGAQEGPPDPT